MMLHINKIPLLLTLLRALLAPVMLAMAIVYPNKLLFGVCLIVAFLSDVFDGIIARHLNIATANLRRLDSMADSIFYAAATLAAWLLYPEVIRQHWGALSILLILEMVRYIFDLVKFRREASYHMWSSKIWGIFLFVGFFSLLAVGHTGVIVTLPIYIGIIADLEGLFISYILTEWRADVPTLFHALRYRERLS
jgi:CDP-diacylglycerol--glycerol-3-phosphate 3-phosphatidyltransferase